MPQSPPTPIPISPMQAMLAGRTASARVPAAARPQLSAPAADITHEGGETARELAAGFTQGITSHRNGLVEAAHYGFRLYEMDDWEAAGFADEEDFLIRHGLSVSAWKTYLVLGDRLSHLTLAQMRGITISAAKLITKIPPKIWEEYAWAEEARLLKAEDFAQLVQKRVGAAAKNRGLAEPKAALSVSVPLRQREKFERRIDLVRKQNHLKTSAETLDYILSLAEQGPGVVTSLERLDQAATELERVFTSSDPALEMASALQLMTRIQRHLKELKKHANGFQGVPEAEQETGSPAASG
jgi:hypothetical protein